MRLRPDELAEWRERAAQTVRPDDYPVPYLGGVAVSDDALYQLALRRYARGAIADLEQVGAPQPDDAERKLLYAREHLRPALTDSCRMTVNGDAVCSGRCRRAAPPA